MMTLPRVYSLLFPTLPLRAETEANLLPTDSCPLTRLYYLNHKLSLISSITYTLLDRLFSSKMYLVPSLLLYLATYTLATSTLSASVLSCLPYCSTYSSESSLSSTSSPDPASQQTQQDMDTVLQGRLAFITASVTQVSQIASWYVNHAMSFFIHI